MSMHISLSIPKAFGSFQENKKQQPFGFTNHNDDFKVAQTARPRLLLSYERKLNGPKCLVFSLLLDQALPAPINTINEKLNRTTNFN